MLAAIAAGTQHTLIEGSHGVEAAAARAEAADPAKVLAAGYALLRDAAGIPLTGTRAVLDAGRVTAELRDGSVDLALMTDSGERHG